MPKKKKKPLQKVPEYSPIIPRNPPLPPPKKKFQSTACFGFTPNRMEEKNQKVEKWKCRE